MAQAARAYSYPQRERAPEIPERPRVRVVPGTGRRTSVETVPETAITAAKVLAVVLVLVALIGFARIAINTATVTTSMSTQDVTSELATARSGSAALEVQQSTLSNPTRIQSAASDLGMSAAESTETISLSPDIVATNDEGGLALAESIRLASQAAS